MASATRAWHRTAGRGLGGSAAVVALPGTGAFSDCDGAEEFAATPSLTATIASAQFQATVNQANLTA